MSTRARSIADAVVHDPRWAAVDSRDARADGSFFYSVKTTGVYCRPSCASRRANPENVDFHATRADAERSGFRPCKRCKPDEPPLAERYASDVAGLCRFIEGRVEIPSLKEIASRAGWSEFHTHRVFKAVTGVTPKAYAEAHRAGRVRHELGKQVRVTDAIYEAGFNSTGRFYETSKRRLGMTPTKFRDGGKNLEIHFSVGTCSLGSLLVAATDRGVCAIFLGEDPAELTRDLARRFPKARQIRANSGFDALVAKVAGLVDDPRACPELPLDIRGTAFQERVWQALREIPAGATTTYSNLARAIGAPRAVRAVASACAANRLAVAIPCHRVVRTDGHISGYRWGIDRKRALLARESSS